MNKLFRAVIAIIITAIIITLILGFFWSLGNLVLSLNLPIPINLPIDTKDTGMIGLCYSIVLFILFMIIRAIYLLLE